MEQQTEEFGVRIYTASPPTNPSDFYPPPQPPTTASGIPRPGAGARTKRAMAKGVQTTLSKTSMLAHFLPTGTLLTFEMVLPSIYGVGRSSTVSTTMMITLLSLCTLSCFFFHFTDSFRTPDGKVVYGFVTTKGLAVFKSGLGLNVPKDDKFHVHFSDFVHAMMSVMVFLSIAFSDHRVTTCLLPEYTKEMEEAMESFPLMVGIQLESQIKKMKYVLNFLR
ncbi:hypothetical protein V2J09_015372 [Rumex salicifolius]